MSTWQKRNLPASVLAHLLERAKRTGDHYQVLSVMGPGSRIIAMMDFDPATLHDWPDHEAAMVALARRWASARPGEKAS
jgi:hypothetical protein